MHRKVIWLVGLLCLFTSPVWGQEDYPRAEIFGAYSVLMADPVVAGREIASGWQASASFNPHKNLGLVADFAGHYKRVTTDPFLGATVKFQAYQYLFGPRFIIRNSKGSGFVHALFGGATVRARVSGTSTSESAFAMGFGGGVDINAGKHLAIRVLQFDYLPVREAGVWSHSTRLAFGLVIKVGGGS